VSANAKQPDRFTDFLRRLVRVPKHEIDEQERQQKRAGDRQPAKAGRIVPGVKRVG
jgi:hypothetical protein